MTVLRKGEYIGTKAIADVIPSILAEMMIGQKKPAMVIERVEVPNRQRTMPNYLAYLKKNSLELLSTLR